MTYLYTALQGIGGHVAEIGTKFAHDQQSVDEANCVSVHRMQCIILYVRMVGQWAGVNEEHSIQNYSIRMPVWW